MARVLIIANEKIMRGALKAAVQYEGYEVDVAKDSQEGREKMRSNAYDMAVCDAYLPKSGCIELLDHVKRENMSLPMIVMVSIKNDIEMLVQLVEKGAFELITKPIDSKRFTLTLHKILDYTTLSRKAGVIEYKSRKRIVRFLIQHFKLKAFVKKLKGAVSTFFIKR